MKITRKNHELSCKFEEVKQGDTFLYQNELYLTFVDEVVNQITGECANAISIRNGELKYFGSQAIVYPVKSEVII